MSTDTALLAAALTDRYRLERELGAGGMATVYLAADLKHDRKVAIKVLKPELAAVVGAERFVQEIKTTAALSHPHILPLFDSGEAGGFLYYVMPYIQGETIRDRLNRETQLGVDEAIRITTEVADALDYAHRSGVIHRDIKPENLLLHDGRAMVMDFGIALAVSAAAGGRMTETGLSLGTLHYMSPEQATADKEITARSDEYSLASVCYEMLSGEPPHMGNSAQQIIMKIIVEPVAPVTARRKSVPVNVAAALDKALEKLPADRFASAKAFAEALANPAFITTAFAGTAATMAPGSPSARAWIRSPWSWAALLVIGALSVLAFTVTTTGSPRGEVVFEQKTFRQMAIFGARFAPDGQTILFSASFPGDEGLTPRLYVIRPEYPEPEALGPDSTHLLAISSTGQMAVLTGAIFRGHRIFEGTLATMPVGGGAPRAVLAGVRDADWAPGGAAMAIVRSVDDVDRLEYPIGTVLATTTGFFSNVRIAPDGDQIAFFEHPMKWDNRGIALIVDRRGKRLAESPVHWALDGISWAPGSDAVHYSATPASRAAYSAMTTLAMGPGGTEHAVLSSAGGLTIHDVAQDGRWLAANDDLWYSLFARAPGATDERELGWLDLVGVPVLSADGSLLAQADQGASGGINYTVLLRTTDGSPVVRLGDGNPLAFTSDNRWLLAYLATTPAQVWLYPTGAGEPRRLDDGQFESIVFRAGGFLPDGKRYFVCGSLTGKGGRCFIGHVNGGPLSAVTPEGTTQAVLSTDGSRMAVQVADTFWVVPLNGEVPRALGGLDREDVLVRWSPDDRELWVFRQRAGTIRVDRVHPESGSRALLQEIRPPANFAGARFASLTISDDPRVYAYLQSPRSSSLFVVTGAQ